MSWNGTPNNSQTKLRLTAEGVSQMAQSDRTLSSAFIDLMTTRDAWPLPKNFENWMREKSGGIRNGVYSRMMQGLSVDPKYVIGLASYLLAHAEKEPNSTTTRTFRDYMETVSSVEPNNMSSPNVAERLLENDDHDYFKRGFTGILDAFRGKKLIEIFVQGCTREKQVHEAVRWLYIWAASELHGRRSFTSLDEAIAFTESAIKISLDQFQKLATMWWQYDDWTVVLARGKRAPTGMSVVLPLRPAIYHAIRNGTFAVTDLQPADLCRPSRFLLIAAIAQRPVILGGDSGNTTKNVLGAHFSQVSILSQCQGEEANQPLHLLAPVGTPHNARRATAMGYKTTGTQARLQGLELFERVYEWPSSAEDMMTLGFSSMLGRYSDRFLQPPRKSYPDGPSDDLENVG